MTVEKRAKLLGYLPFASFVAAILIAAIAGPSLRALARSAMDPTGAISGDIKVTHIIFNHKWLNRKQGPTDKDALSIRNQWDWPLSHGPYAPEDPVRAPEAGAGEWIVDPGAYQTKSARNEPALYLRETKQHAAATTILVRFEAKNVVDADIYYVPVGVWPAVTPIKVSFGDKKAGDELNKFPALDQRSLGGIPDSYLSGSRKVSFDYLTFTYTGVFPNSIMKTTPRFVWWAENVKLKDGTTIGKMQLNTSGLPVDGTSVNGHEFFNVLDTPKIPWYDTDNRTNPWALALREVTNPNAALAQTTYPDAGRKIAIYLFGWKGFTYATGKGGGLRGSPGFCPTTNTDATMHLQDYLLVKDGENPQGPNVVNCYDQAAGIVCLFNLVGANSTFQFKEPYGFINAGQLVGIQEQVNNPFPGTRPYLMDPNDITRSKFLNHAYALYSTKAYDACAGPEVGTRVELDHWKFQIDTVACLAYKASTGVDAMNLTAPSQKIPVKIEK